MRNFFSVLATPLHVHENFVLTARALMPLINANADVFSGFKCLIVGLSPHLHPYFVYAIILKSLMSLRVGDSLEPSLLDVPK